MEFKGRYFYCDVNAIQNKYVTISTGDVYQIDETVNINFRDMDNSIYNTDVIEIPTPVAFTYDHTTDQLDVGSSISTATPLLLYSDNNVLPVPLVEEQIYYAINVDATHIRLAYTSAKATSGEYIDIQNTVGVGVTTFSQITVYAAGAIVATSQGTFTANISTEQLTVGVNIPSGTAIRFTTTTTLPAPLAISTTYFAINIDAAHIQVATTYANATALTPVYIDLTTVGTGTHTIYIADTATSQYLVSTTGYVIFPTGTVGKQFRLTYIYTLRG
jgi:hypothetical protein